MSTDWSGGLRRGLPWLVLAVPLLIYAVFLLRYAINVPLGDDIPDVLGTVLQVIGADGAGDIYGALFQQHNDHRTLSSRMLYLLVYALDGEIDFKVLVYVANAGPVLLLGWFALVLPRQGRMVLLVAAAFILLQPRAYGILLWPMAALAYYGVYLYAAFAILLLHRVTPARLSLAALFAALSTFSLASGQLAWLVGALSLCHQGFVLRRASPGYLVGWVVLASLCLLAWRYGLETPNTPGTMLMRLAEAPLYYVTYTLALAGNAVTETSLPLAIGCGIVLTATTLFFLFRRRCEQDLRLELFSLFVLLSIAAMTLGRAFLADMEYALSSRYSVPPVLLLACATLMAGRALAATGTYRVLAVPVLAAVFWMWSWQHWPGQLQPYYDDRLARYNRDFFGFYGGSPAAMKAVVREAEAREIYRPPERPLVKPPLSALP